MLFIILKIIFWSSLFLIVYSYCLYPLLLVLFQRINRPAPVVFKDAHYLPKVSIVIAAYNEEKTIRHRIENCLALDYPFDQLEIIIASDGSSDQTNSITKEYAHQGVKLFDFKERRGKINILNDSIARASHEIIVLSDANTMFARDALKKLVRHFQYPQIGCVCGLLYFVNTKGTKTGDLEGFYWRYETHLKKMEGTRGSLLGANGAIYAIRKNLFQACPTETIVDDFLIPMKILARGYKVIYDPDATASEEFTQQFIQEKERRIRIGAGDFHALTLLWPMLNPLRGFSAIAFLSHKVLRWFAPFFLVFLFITSIMLVNHGIVYDLVLWGQILFYMAAMAGQALSHTPKPVRLFALCYYFVSMNIALFLGFYKFLRGRQKATWQRTER